MKNQWQFFWGRNECGWGLVQGCGRPKDFANLWTLIFERENDYINNQISVVV